MDELDIEIRSTTETDLPGILRLYAQPGMDDGRVLAENAAAQIFRLDGVYVREDHDGA
jgi:hypothetical protein